MGRPFLLPLTAADGFTGHRVMADLVISFILDAERVSDACNTCLLSLPLSLRPVIAPRRHAALHWSLSVGPSQKGPGVPKPAVLCFLMLCCRRAMLILQCRRACHVDGMHPLLCTGYIKLPCNALRCC